ncbi:MAG: hypothetical protein AAF849_06210 [Bacteroidota bacterium]
MNIRLKNAFEDRVREEFIFLLDLNYQIGDITEESSNLIGTSYTFNFVNEELDRNVSISVSVEEHSFSHKFISLFIAKNLNKENGNANDYIELDRLCKSRNISIHIINNIRQNKIKSVENLNIIIKEYANILRSHFHDILTGKEWIEGLYPEWR